MSARDSDVRRRALSPMESFVLSAPAGSGKTSLLAARVLNLMARGGPGGGPCDPRSILAVTFTEKAAVEMQARVAGLLRRAAGPATRPESEWDKVLCDLAADARRAHGGRQEILDNPRVFRIGTFHGFCAGVVHGWPAEAGVPAGVPVLSQERQEAAVMAAVRTHLRELSRRPTGESHRTTLERRLAALGNREEALVDRLCTLLCKRDRLPDVWDLLERGDMDAAEARLSGILRMHLGERMAPVVAHFRANAEAWIALGDALDDNPAPGGKRLPEEIPGDRLEDLATWLDVAGVFLSRGGEPRRALQAQWGFPPDLADRLKEFIRSTPEDVAAPLAFLQGLELDRTTVTGVMGLLDYLDLAAGALAALAPQIPGRGLDFLELELAAERALSGSGWPADPLLFYDAALRHVLVDESQDLNPTQVDILGLLLEGWEAGDGRTLFLVGDPKQSIYRFRGSEVSLFERLLSRGVPRHGPRPYLIPPQNRMRLTSNFRSDPDLVRFCNGLFSRVFPISWEEEADEVPMEQSEPEAQGYPSEGKVRIALFPFDNRRKEKSGPDRATAREAEAAWLASEVLLLLRERPEDSVGILIPRRTRVDLYARAFASAGVPVQMVEGEKLAYRPEVLHLHNLLRALAMPHDDLAWAGVVRAPWNRVSDSVLATITPPEGSPPGAWKKAVLEHKEPTLCALRPPLLDALEDIGREELHETLERAWEGLGGPRAIAARYGAAGVANSLRYIEIVRSCAGLAHREAIGAVESLLSEAYTPPDPASASSPIRLMTIHQAKGLEFDHVYAIGLEYDPFKANRSHAEPIRVLPLSVGGELVRMAAVEGDVRSPERVLAYEILADLDERRQAAEVKRLFYVACTRARRHLTLTGVPSRPPTRKGEAHSGSYSAPKASPLALLLDAAAEGLALPLEEPDFRRHADPPPRPPIPAPAATLHFAPFPSPYRVRSASASEGADAPEAYLAPGHSAQGPEAGRAYGIVLHRVMESLLQHRPPPASEAVATALKDAGFDRERCAETAAPLLREACDLMADPCFSAMVEGSEVHTEWAVEHHDGQGTVMAGRLDLLLVKPGEVIAMDFKTSRPKEGQAIEDFKAEMRRAYRPQMVSYLLALKAFSRFADLPLRAFLAFPCVPEIRLVEMQIP